MAVFTKKPLKNIEKPAGASTCVLVNQYCNGQIGTLKPKPKNKSKYKYQTSSPVKLKSLIEAKDVFPTV